MSPSTPILSGHNNEFVTWSWINSRECYLSQNAIGKCTLIKRTISFINITSVHVLSKEKFARKFIHKVFSDVLAFSKIQTLLTIDVLDILS